MSTRAASLLSGGIRRRPALALPWYGLAIFTFFLVAARWSEIFTEIGIYVALLGLLLRPAELRFPPPLRWAAAFLLWASVTALFAISPDIAGQALYERLKTFVVFFVVINVLRTPQQLRIYILLILFAFFIYPARGTLVNYLRGETIQGRALWNRIYNNPNELAAITLLMLGVTLAIAAVKTRQLRVRWAVIAFVPVLLTIGLLTQSRGAFIGLLAGFGPPLLARIRKLPRVAIPVLVVFCVIASLVPATVRQRLGGIVNLTSSAGIAHSDSSARQRFEILKIGLHIAATHPVLGVGIGCYNQANMRYAPDLGARDAHNTYVGLAAETGLPGLVLWLGVIGSVLAQVRRRRASLEADNGTFELLWIERGVIGYLIAGVFGTYSGLTMFYLFLGILSAGENMLGRSKAAGAHCGSRKPVRHAAGNRRQPNMVQL